MNDRKYFVITLYITIILVILKFITTILITSLDPTLYILITIGGDFIILITLMFLLSLLLNFISNKFFFEKYENLNKLEEE